ncbi:MAG: hypothetical protein ACE366_01335 [Bradymonadia bacterium]
MKTLTAQTSPRKMTGPGMSEGALSARFPEIEVEVTSSFAHDRGMMSYVKSQKVGGEEVGPKGVLYHLVKLRKGWTAQGGSSDEEALTVFKHFIKDWNALFEYSTRITTPELPDHLKRLSGGFPGLPPYHPPKFEVRTLESGEKVVVHSYFSSWDGGNHGRQMGYSEDAYLISTGEMHRLPRPGEQGLLKRQ